jgi:predicted dehydrogenase
MAVKRLGIIMHGVTGRMGMNQHLVRSILAIREEGGVMLSNGERVEVDPILVGRNPEKIEALARQYAVPRWSADIDAALANPEDTIFFDAATTQPASTSTVRNPRRNRWRTRSTWPATPASGA